MGDNLQNIAVLHVLKETPKGLSCITRYLNSKYDNRKRGTIWILFKLITSYIVFQDDIVMIDRVVDKVNLGCEHMVQVKFQLLCHLEGQKPILDSRRHL